ncbi:MAG: HEPN domain-containing protein [Tepidisphaerales bacterium]
MPTWNEISLDSFHAAGLLFRAGRWRSCISRYYYGAFGGVTEAIRARGYVRPGYETPPHREIPRLIDRHLAHLYPKQRRAMKAAVRRMYDARIVADYRSQRTSDRDVATNVRRDAVEIYRLLGVNI